MNSPYYPFPHPKSRVPDAQVTDLLENGHFQPELNYHKGLAHDSDGRVLSAPFEKLLIALDEHTPAAFRNIDIGTGTGSSRRLVNPQAGYASDRECVDGWRMRIPLPPELTNDLPTTAAEILELYWMAALRDLEFENWSGDPNIASACQELSGLPLYSDPNSPNSPQYISRQLNPQNLFRGGDWNFDNTPERFGPNLSQFLWLNVPYGMQSFKQLERRRVASDYVPNLPGSQPHMTTWSAWLDVQNGADVAAGILELSDPQQTYIHNMAGMARYVHLDKLYQAYLNAAFILVGAKVPFDRGNPYGKACDELGYGSCLPPGSSSRFPKEEGFGTFDVPHILSLVTEAATRALKAVWYQKWVMNLRMRPEAFGGLIHRCFGQEAGVFTADGVVAAKSALNPCLPELQDSVTNGILSQNHQNHGTYLLPMSFEEGSPTHPAYGAGHATVAGACVTILKAFFDESVILSDHINEKPNGASYHPLMPRVPDPAAGYRELTDYAGADASQMTVGGELDKLASNISLGRNMAGVHWRTDHTQSLLLGQRVAVSILYRQRVDYHERPWSFRFTSFCGNNIEITFDPDQGREGVFMNGGQILDFRDDSRDEDAEARKLEAIC